jgi:putative oxidoreductase
MYSSLAGRRFVMSATSRGFRATSDTDDVVATARAHATVPRDSALYRLVATDRSAAATIARLTLGLVMFPHAAQKTFGWFGGHGFSGTYGFFTSLGLPGPLAALAIVTELLASIMLIVGAFTRAGALAIIGIMLGAIALVHAPNGFFMNWTGDQAGEGFELHLLAIGLGLVVFALGGGKASIDRLLMRRRPAEGGSLAEPITRD